MNFSKSKIAQTLGNLFNSEYDPMDPDLVREYNQQRPEGPKPTLCSAPFSSMRFNRSGDATPCCQNYSLGSERYPDKSIREIWFGDKYQQLRKHVQHDDLSMSCEFCKVHMVSKNFSSVLASSYDYLPINKNKFPSYMDFSIDNTCNLECTMCNGSLSSSIRKNRDHLPPLTNPYDQEFVNQLEEFIPHLQGANFSGGEAFLIDLHYDIWHKMIELNPQMEIIITTNGTILNKRVKEVLEKGRFNLNISIESLEKESYEKIRVNAKFENVMENIDYFHNYCKNKKTQLNIAVCPLRQNWKELPAFVKFCNELEAKLFLNIVTRPFNLALWSLDSSELKEIHAYLNGFDFPVDTSTSKENAEAYASLVLRVKTWLNDALKREEITVSNNPEDLKIKSKQIVAEKITTYVSQGGNHNGLDEKSKTLVTKMNEALDKLPDRFYTDTFVDKMFELPMEVVVKEIEEQGIETLVHHMSSLSYYSMTD